MLLRRPAEFPSKLCITLIHLRALLCLGVAAHALKADMLEACPGERVPRNVCQRSDMVHRDVDE
jgi:hypothetical protein